MNGFLKWFGDAFAHAMGAIDAEEKSHVPPPIGMTPYRDQPMKRGHGYKVYELLGLSIPDPISGHWIDGDQTSLLFSLMQEGFLWVG